jgi:hypothetical protein
MWMRSYLYWDSHSFFARDKWETLIVSSKGMISWYESWAPDAVDGLESIAGACLRRASLLDDRACDRTVAGILARTAHHHLLFRIPATEPRKSWPVTLLRLRPSCDARALSGMRKRGFHHGAHREGRARKSVIGAIRTLYIGAEVMGGVWGGAPGKRRVETGILRSIGGIGLLGDSRFRAHRGKRES